MKFYEVVELCKEDLLEVGLSKAKVKSLTDEDMGRIARKVGDLIMADYWEALEVIIKEL